MEVYAGFSRAHTHIHVTTECDKHLLWGFKWPNASALKCCFATLRFHHWWLVTYCFHKMPCFKYPDLLQDFLAFFYIATGNHVTSSSSSCHRLQKFTKGHEAKSRKWRGGKSLEEMGLEVNYEGIITQVRSPALFDKSPLGGIRQSARMVEVRAGEGLFGSCKCLLNVIRCFQLLVQLNTHIAVFQSRLVLLKALTYGWGLKR